MKNRILYFILSIFLMFSASAGNKIQKAIFSAHSDEIKIVTTSSSAQFLAPEQVNESKIIQQNITKSQKKSSAFHNINPDEACERINFIFNFLSFTSSSISTTRILLLPKTIKILIFLQTLF